MPVYHQMGHHSENLLLVPELNRYAGAILSPVNYAENEIADQIRLAERIGEFECLLDPQLYYPNTMRGRLREWSYFPDDVDTADIASDAWWDRLLDALCGVCARISPSGLCSPAVVPRVFGDAYYGQLVAVGNRLSDRLVGTPITAIQTALVSVDDVASSERANAISSVFTASRCDRLYLVLCGAVEPRRELADVEALKGAMMLIRLLRDAGVSVVVGFCSSDVVLWKIAGAEACATGKFFNLRRFTSSRFDEPSQGGGQLPYWYEESLVAFLRESDVLRLQRRGELSDASLANPFGQAILGKFIQEPGTAWLALGWKQFMYWFMDVESRIAEGRIDVPGMLQGAETMWLALEDTGVLMEEPRNNGSWLRPWRRAVSEYRL